MFYRVVIHSQTSTNRFSKTIENFPPAKKRFHFVMDDDDFKELSRGFAPQNTSMDTEKYARLFEVCTLVRSMHACLKYARLFEIVVGDARLLCISYCPGGV